MTDREAPEMEERLRLRPTFYGASWLVSRTHEPSPNGTEYVRADLYAALEEQLAKTDTEFEAGIAASQAGEKADDDWSDWRKYGHEFASRGRRLSEAEAREEAWVSLVRECVDGEWCKSDFGFSEFLPEDDKRWKAACSKWIDAALGEGEEL